MNHIQEEAAKKYEEIELLDKETMAMLNEYAAGAPEIVKDIIDSYEPEATGIIQEIKKAIANRDAISLQTTAHSLAGISGAIGAKRLKQVCSDTENAIKAGNFEMALLITPHIFINFDKVLEQLKNI